MREQFCAASAAHIGVLWALDGIEASPRQWSGLWDDLHQAAYERMLVWWRDGGDVWRDGKTTPGRGGPDVPLPRVFRGYPEWRSAAHMASRGAAGLIRRTWGARAGDRHLALVQFVETEERELPDALAEELLALFFDQRKKRGQRGLQAAARDVAIVALLVAGYPNDAIAMTLDISYNSVKQYRRDIRGRLEAIQKEFANEHEHS